MKQLLIFILLSSCSSFNGSVYLGLKSEHFDGKRFINENSQEEPSGWSLFKWLFNRDRGFWNDFTNAPPGPKPKLFADDGEIIATFINHSTVLLQTDSINILTDPVYSDRVTPISFIGPLRHRPPGIKFEDLPKIDIVIISHNHYDHLDLPTLKRLRERFDPLIVAPLGNKKFLNSQGFEKVVELDWNQDIMIKDKTKLTFVQGRHFSGRGLSDRNRTLWGGYILSSIAGPIYFAGDTGFGSHFDKIYKQFGEIAFSMLPIGAYRPRWFMKSVHMNPDDAVKAHIALHSKLSMGIHFGTFAQADDGEFEPIKDLQIALKKNHINENEFFVPEHGKRNEIVLDKVVIK